MARRYRERSIRHKKAGAFPGFFVCRLAGGGAAGGRRLAGGAPVLAGDVALRSW